MEDEQIKEFVAALQTAVVAANDATLKDMLGAIVNPMLARLDAIATAQVGLASVLRTNRRDQRATEFAKVLIPMRMAKARQDDVALQEIVHTSYMLASLMETHAIVGEFQEKGMLEALAERVKKQPNADPVALARAFLSDRA